MLNVRYGKAKRGQPLRRRNVASVMAWAVEAVADYVDNIRPRFGCLDHPGLWVTERGGRIKPSDVDDRFAAYRKALGLPEVWWCTACGIPMYPPDRRRGRPAVHPDPGRPRKRQLDGDLHPRQQRFHEHGPAARAGARVHPGTGRTAAPGRERG